MYSNKEQLEKSSIHCRKEPYIFKEHNKRVHNRVDQGMHSVLEKGAVYIARKEPLNFLEKGATEWIKECMMKVF